jgi:hypothetical protein
MAITAHRRGSTLAAGLAATMLAGSPAGAQEAGSTSQHGSMVAGQAASAPWELAITPYAWATSLHGDVGLGRRTADVDVEFSDLVQDLNGALMLDVELRKGRFALMSDTVYANLEDDGSALDDRVKVKAKMNQLIQTLAGSYRAGKWQLAELGGTVPLAVAIDPYVGIRYTYLDTELDGKLDLPRLGVEDSRTAEGDKQWVDPIVGLRTIWTLGDRLSLIAAGDIGGTSPDDQYSWGALGVVGYRFGLFGERNANLLAGYKVLKQKFEDGDGRSAFECDVTMHGPVLGLTINF